MIVRGYVPLLVDWRSGQRPWNRPDQLGGRAAVRFRVYDHGGQRAWAFANATVM